MKLLFVADPLERFKTYKDTTYAMMREAAARGHSLHSCEARELQWWRDGRVSARVREIALTGDAHEWFRVLSDSGVESPLAVADFDAVLMRKDPPFDSEYFYATHLLEQAEREGARVFNKAAALRDHPEKLSILEFPHFIAPTLVSRDAEAIRAFHAEQRDIVLKPLDGMGGTGIFRVGPDGLNLGAIIEALNDNGRHTVMAQAYLSEITEGDKRIVVIDGKPVPYVLARIPQGSEIRGNLARGGKGVGVPLSDRDRWIAAEVGPELKRRGMLFVGLDVIGAYLTEINVTSPTCIRELDKAFGLNIAGELFDVIEAKLK
jgi:glutathione synthase